MVAHAQQALGKRRTGRDVVQQGTLSAYLCVKIAPSTGAAVRLDDVLDRTPPTEHEMKIEGTVVEIGDLEGMTTPGIRIESGNQFIAISGLTREQITSMPPVVFRTVTIEIELAA